MHGESPIKRRESRKIWVGNVPVGGDAPIAVQSMTNSDTNDVAATVAATSLVSLLVMLCTAIGASPPTGTLPTQILRDSRRLIGDSPSMTY